MTVTVQSLLIRGESRNRVIHGGGAFQPMVGKTKGGGILHYSGPPVEKSHPHLLAWHFLLSSYMEVESETVS